MPQPDTSTWFITILSMILVLFIMFQLKSFKYIYTSNPELKYTKTQKQLTPWEAKWTKIFCLFH